MADSFFGGRKGQDFYIKQIFNTKLDMDSDLASRWASPISIGEYVLISYGLPSDPNYETYRTIDLQEYGQLFNSTLWQKIYTDEGTETDGGFEYKLISSLAGNTPQVSVQKPAVVLGPGEEPDVDTLSNSSDEVTLRFSMPRAVKFYYGDFLDSPTPETQQLTDSSFADYLVGDYYINKTNGYIFLITAKDGNTCTFQFQACLTGPLPQITSTAISPYELQEGSYVATEAKATRTFVSEDGSAWTIEFQLPKEPDFQINTSFIGVEDQGSSSSNIIDEDTVALNFNIPRGANIFAGTAVSESNLSASVAGSARGDIYLNTTTGYVYKLGDNWIRQAGAIQGPPGNPLSIVASYIINEDDTMTDSLEDGVLYIESNYSEEITPSDLFAITWIEQGTQAQTSYWYFEDANGIWGRVQLTGAVASFIINDYNAQAPTDQAYSASYINGLIGGDMDSKDKTRTAYSATQVDDLLGNLSLSTWGTFEDLI